MALIFNCFEHVPHQSHGTIDRLARSGPVETSMRLFSARMQFPVPERVYPKFQNAAEFGNSTVPTALAESSTVSRSRSRTSGGSSGCAVSNYLRCVRGAAGASGGIVA